MRVEQWHVGQSVWATGRAGWRPAVITCVGYKWIKVLFQDGSQAYGRRQPEQLRPRDRALAGEDKPTGSLSRPLRGKMGEKDAEASKQVQDRSEEWYSEIGHGMAYGATDGPIIVR